jgi:hypothetical protein
MKLGLATKFYNTTTAKIPKGKITRHTCVQQPSIAKQNIW